MNKHSYYRPIVTARLIMLILRNSFDPSGGAKHGKYVRELDDATLTIPRHTKLSSGLSYKIAQQLVNEYSIPKKDVDKLF